MSPTKEHWVSIRWGADRDIGDKPDLYEFHSRAELEAFLDGVEAATGWLDYELVKESPAGGLSGFQKCIAAMRKYHTAPTIIRIQ